MIINVTGKNLKINDYIHDLVVNKVGKPLDKHLANFDEEIKSSQLIIEQRSRWGYKFKFDLRLPKKEHIYAEAVDDELMTGLVKLREKVEQQIKHYRTKLMKAPKKKKK